jgi:O-antigen biosynthesis protein
MCGDIVNETLAQLYARHSGKVSDKWSSYLLRYEALLSSRRHSLQAILEIGVQNGGSLEIWAKYFPQAQAVVGCDIDSKCAELRYADPRVRIVVGDATQDATLANVLESASEFDVVIDDGSHIPKDVVRAFALYWPKVKPGGLFIAEDLHCDYFPTHQGGIARGDIANRFFAELVHLVNYEHWADGDAAKALFARFALPPGSSPESWVGTIASVNFYNSIVVVEKASSVADTVLGQRVIVGDAATVEEEILEIRANGEAGLAHMRARVDHAQSQTFASLFNRK